MTNIEYVAETISFRHTVSNNSTVFNIAAFNSCLRYYVNKVVIDFVH